jgi:hypothetical protein
VIKLLLITACTIYVDSSNFCSIFIGIWRITLLTLLHTWLFTPHFTNNETFRSFQRSYFLHLTFTSTWSQYKIGTSRWTYKSIGLVQNVTTEYTNTWSVPCMKQKIARIYFMPQSHNSKETFWPHQILPGEITTILQHFPRIPQIEKKIVKLP